MYKDIGFYTEPLRNSQWSSMRLQLPWRMSDIDNGWMLWVSVTTERSGDWSETLWMCFHSSGTFLVHFSSSIKGPMLSRCWRIDRIIDVKESVFMRSEVCLWWESRSWETSPYRLQVKSLRTRFKVFSVRFELHRTFNIVYYCC